MIIVEHRFHKCWLGILASIFLGMTFIVAGSGKLFAGVVDFELFIRSELLSPVIVGALNTLLTPLVELALGLFLVAGIAIKFMASFSLLLTAGFITNNILLINLGLGNEPCNCFGMGQELSVIGSLYLDGVMVALAVMVLVFYPGRFFEARPWYWAK